ncbi:uncharacterized protein LOC119591131 [Penaeus monodon]|uniref:uncharacterized protein LOC119591131 n=1 Tax=Penaeus monodon TaxID=6687 RepID=UPI0018A709AF|nr:uncharacterized protein LOC119591131 [Penaeus monodon]
MDICGLFLLFFVILSRDAFVRSTEGTKGESDRKASRKETVETPYSEDAGEVLTPWEPRSWLPEQRKRQLLIRSQGYGQRDQGSSVAQTPREGARIPPPAQPSPRTMHITRLVPVFMSSEFVGAAGGVSGLYSPPTTEPPTPDPGALVGFAVGGLHFQACTNVCENRNSFGGCDVNVTCLFSQRVNF